MIVIEPLLSAGIDSVVHRAHIQRRHMRFQGPDMSYSGVSIDTDGTGGVVDDRFRNQAFDGLVYLAVTLHVEGGLPVILASVDMHDSCPCIDTTSCFLGDLFSGVYWPDVDPLRRKTPFHRERCVHSLGRPSAIPC